MCASIRECGRCSAPLPAEVTDAGHPGMPVPFRCCTWEIFFLPFYLFFPGTFVLLCLPADGMPVPQPLFNFCTWVGGWIIKGQDPVLQGYQVPRGTVVGTSRYPIPCLEVPAAAPEGTRSYISAPDFRCALGPSEPGISTQNMWSEVFRRPRH